MAGGQIWMRWQQSSATTLLQNGGGYSFDLLCFKLLVTFFLTQASFGDLIYIDKLFFFLRDFKFGLANHFIFWNQSFGPTLNF